MTLFVSSVENKVTDNLTAAMKVINQNTFYNDQPVWNDNRPQKCDESLGDGEVKLACRCMLPVVARLLVVKVSES